MALGGRVGWTRRRRGVRLDDRRIPRSICRGRSEWHSCHSALEALAGGGPMNIHHKSHPWPTAPLREAVSVDPIVLQIVEGTLNSIEAEIEYAIERTARSPMIREPHDFRARSSRRYCRSPT